MYRTIAAGELDLSVEWRTSKCDESWIIPRVWWLKQKLIYTNGVKRRFEYKYARSGIQVPEGNRISKHLVCNQYEILACR